MTVAPAVPVATLAAVLTLAPGVAVEVPVVPDAEQARRLLERELADPVYHQGPSILQRVLDWLGTLFAGADGVPLGSLGTVLLVVAALALLVLVAFLVTGPVRRGHGRGRAGAVLHADDRRTAADLRGAADAAAARGDWSAAVADRFRAVVRSLEERAVLDERPGRTAHEAVATAGVRLPGEAAGLRAAGLLFDDVVYGHRAPGAAEDARLRELDAQVAASRPIPVPGLVTTSPGTGA